MLDTRFVAWRRIGVGEDGAVLLYRRGPHLLREDDGEILSYHLRRTKAIERAIGGVDRNDGAVRIGKGHRLGGCLPDGPEAFFTLAQRGLDRALLCSDGWWACFDLINHGRQLVVSALRVMSRVALASA